MNRRNFVQTIAISGAAASLALTGCTTTSGGDKSPETAESKRQQIDAAVNGTLSRLGTAVKGSNELMAKAQGVLVFPDVKKATVGYYSTTAASFGFQAGVQSTAIVFLFMTKDALDKFRSSNGWSAGADAGVSVARTGANGALDTSSVNSQVVALVLTNAGLMADLSLSGTKVNRLDL
jgi:lipid-binding SYLF domain-containing protein